MVASNPPSSPGCTMEMDFVSCFEDLRKVKPLERGLMVPTPVQNRTTSIRHQDQKAVYSIDIIGIRVSTQPEKHPMVELCEVLRGTYACSAQMEPVVVLDTILFL